MLTNPQDAVVAQQVPPLAPQGASGARTSDASRDALLSRTLPFALFMAFVAADEGTRLLASAGTVELEPSALYYLYPVKALSVAFLLYLFRSRYRELRLSDLAADWSWLFTCAAGVGTCILWVCLDWTLAGSSPGFDPMLLPQGGVRVVMTVFRVAGAVLVVPLMEELFWRSFLLRYLIDPDFESVATGRFTWPSFLVTSILFGLEHHLFVAGVVAGVVYNLLLYKTRSVAHCVLAHAVTNLALAIYVLFTGKWYFW